jgi:hypothetical protein
MELTDLARNENAQRKTFVQQPGTIGPPPALGTFGGRWLETVWLQRYPLGAAAALLPAEIMRLWHWFLDGKRYPMVAAMISLSRC